MPTMNFPSAAHSLEKLEETIKMALQKTGAQKEIDLCAYIPDQGGRLSPSTYLKLKDTDPETLYELITIHILDADPYKIPTPMETSHPEQPYTGKPLKECIQEAMEKLNIQNETALCKYIPDGEGHIHHFTYLKMKSANPVQARNLIQEHILGKAIPQRLPPKPRKRRHHGRQKDVVNVIAVKEELDQVISRAMRRPDLNLQQEKDLCRYIPHGNSFLHASTYRRLKHTDPGALIDLIKEHVIDSDHPRLLEWRSTERYPSRSLTSPDREAENSQNLQDEKIDQLLGMVGQLTQAIGQHGQRVAQDNTRLPDKQSTERGSVEECLQILQQELIMKIIRKEADQNLWRIFTRLTENKFAY